MKTALKVGVGRSVITPPVGTLLYGYPQERPAESIHDDLRVTCLALQSGGHHALLISADICTIDRADACRWREQIRAQTGIPTGHILLAATHTHSGPASTAGAGWGTSNQAYNRHCLQPKIMEAVRAAYAGRQEALLGVGVTRSDIGINRRQVDRNGKVLLGQNTWAAHDPDMTVLAFRTPGGEPIANVVHYGCHGTAAGKGLEITRDWSGPMVDALEEQCGGVTVFFNGPEGDIGPRLPNGKTIGNLKLAMDLGARAGIDAVRAWRTIREYRAVELGIGARDLHLPWKTLPDPETARREMENLGDTDLLTGKQRRQSVHWQQIIDEHATGRPVQTHGAFPQSVMVLGPVAFVSFPFELFVEIGLRIRAESPFPHTLCLSNTNGSLGYFPSRDQYARGGYEIMMAQFGDTYELAEDADTAAVEQSLQMLESLAGAANGVGKR